MLNAISYVCVPTWQPVGTTEGTKQLVPPTMPKGIVGVYQQLSMGHERWYIHPMLGQGDCGWEKDLQFFATCLIYLPQLLKLVGLIHILGQPAHPEVVDQRPILGYIGHSPHGGMADENSPYRTHKTMAHYAISCHQTRQCIPCGRNGCTSHRVSWWANHGPACTMYMASHLMAAWFIQAGQLHAH